jgi:hypothetical protein
MIHQTEIASRCPDTSQFSIHYGATCLVSILSTHQAEYQALKVHSRPVLGNTIQHQVDVVLKIRVVRDIGPDEAMAE